jgi:hypothetical protein
MHRLQIRPGEGGRVVRFGVFIALTIAVSIVLTAFNDASFLARFRIELLPWAFIASSFAMMTAALLFDRMVQNTALARVTSLTPAAFAAFLLALWGINQFPAPGLGFGVYVAVAVIIGLTMIVGWNYVRAAFDSRTTKRLIPLMGVAAGLGAILGGLLARTLAQIIGTDFLLVVGAAGLLGVAAAANWTRRDLLERGLPDGSGSALPTRTGWIGTARESLGLITRNRLMVLATLLLILAVFGKTLIDYQFKTNLKLHFSKDEIAVFLGNFYAITNILELCGLLLLSSHLLSRYGLRGALGGRFVIIALLAAFNALNPLFWGFIIMRASDAWLNRVWFKNGTALIFAPIPSHRSSRVRLIQEGFIEPLVVIAASGTLLLLPLWLSLAQLSWILVITGVLAFALAWRSERPYREALSNSIDHQLFSAEGAFPSGGRIDEETLGEIRQRLRVGELSSVQLFALRLVETGNISGLGDAVLELLNAPEPEVRSRAAEIATAIGAPAAGQHLHRHLQEETEPSVVAATLRALVNADAELALEEAYRRLEADALEVRAEALLILFRHGGLDGILAGAYQLVELNKGKTGDRLMLARLLARMDLGQLDRTLLPLLDDPVHEVRTVAYQAAGFLLSGAVARRLLEDLRAIDGEGSAELALLAEQALARRPEVAWAALAESGPPQGARGRAAAARLLAGVWNTTAHRWLEEWLASEWGMVRYESLKALEMHRVHGLPTDVAKLENLLLEELRRIISLRIEARDRHGLEHRELRIRASQAQERVMIALALRYDRDLIHQVQEGLRSHQLRIHANAIELLDASTHGTAEKLFLRLLEPAEPDWWQLRTELGLASAAAVRAVLEAEAAADNWLRITLGGARDADISPTHLEWAQQLATNDLFGAFPLKALYGLVLSSRRLSLATGASWSGTESPPDRFWFVIAGRLETKTGRQAGPGDLVGFYECLCGQPATLAWTAPCTSEVLELRREIIERKCRANPTWAQELTDGLLAAARAASVREARFGAGREH